MINPNELRIKSYVYRKFLNPDPKGENIGHTTCQVMAIGIETVHTSEKLGRNGIIKGLYDNLEPIPLTEEWLINFGFTHKNGYGFSNGYLQNIMKSQCNKFRVWQYHNIRVELYYVHQLQNLYFALTQKELTLNE